MKFLKVVVIVFLFSNICYGETAVYFSPKGGCEQAVVNLFASAKTKIDVAVYSINNKAILAAIDSAKARGVKLRILTDHVQAAGNAAVTVGLEQKGYDFRLHSVGKIMHNKFAIFDDKKSINGSFNWTNPAEQVNEENCLITDEPAVVAKFSNQFSTHLWVVNTKEKSDVHLAKIKKKFSERSMASDSNK